MTKKDNFQPSSIYRLLDFIMNKIIPRGFWRLFGQPPTEAGSSDGRPLQRERSMENSTRGVQIQSRITNEPRRWTPTAKIKNGVKAILENLPFKKDISLFHLHPKESKWGGGFRGANDKWSNEGAGNPVSGERSRPRRSVATIINEKSDAFIRNKKEAMLLNID